MTWFFAHVWYFALFNVGLFVGWSLGILRGRSLVKRENLADNKSVQHRFDREIMRKKALGIRLARAEWEDSPREPTFERASGDMTCSHCGFVYYDHPEHPGSPYLVVLCSGRLVKL